MTTKITQDQFRKELDSGKTVAAIAAEYEVNERTLWRKKAAMARSGWSPDHDMTHTVPDGFHVKGTSTLYGDDGKPRMQWVKSSIDHERQKELQAAAIEAMADDIPRYKTPKYTIKNPNKDIIPWFNLGDSHLGMLAHEDEVGHNFDLKIAQRELCAAMGILIYETPACERCVIQDMGDMTHIENFPGVTEASGHALDYDGRFPKMINTYVKVMRFIVDRALAKFKYVDIIINQGNHSRTNDIWMRHLLMVAYEKTKRINVLDNSSVFIPYRMGNTFVMTHHSDKCKPAKLADVMATDFAQDWGESKYRYIDIGHIHHRMQAKEMAGVTIESWNQLAPSDKYAHDGGWRSRQCLTVVDRSKTYGEVARRMLPVERVQDILAGLKPGESCNKRRTVYTV